jgi:hypothetical protein
MSNQELFAQFSPHLFWDVDTSQLVWPRDELFLFERVMTYGNYNDWQLLKSLVTKQVIQKLARKANRLDSFSRSFLHTYYEVPYQEMQCIQKQSAHPLFDF